MGHCVGKYVALNHHTEYLSSFPSWNITTTPIIICAAGESVLISRCRLHVSSGSDFSELWDAKTTASTACGSSDATPLLVYELQFVQVHREGGTFKGMLCIPEGHPKNIWRHSHSFLKSLFKEYENSVSWMRFLMMKKGLFDISMQLLNPNM